MTRAWVVFASAATGVLCTLAAAARDAHAQRPALDGAMTHDAGEIRVHYATTGVDTPPADDPDGNGVPDFVEEVATTANDALDRLMALGFRRPVNDGALGGDNKIDIYLRNLIAADGNVTPDSCAGGACVTYAIAENDYAGYAYASRTEAIRSVVPHELFHMIQYAYTDEHAIAWSEGTAVWAVEHLYGDGNDDFERFVPGFLTKTFRPFERAGGGFSDPYPYGAALWPVFLEQRFDAQVMREAWEDCATAPFLSALDAALATRDSSLNDAWLEFTRWNAFTGGYAVAGTGYSAAASYVMAPREPLLSDDDGAGTANVYIEGLSARYLALRVNTEAELTVAPTEGIEVGAHVTRTGDGIDAGMALEAGDVLRARLSPGMYGLAITGLTQNTITTKVELSLGPPQPGDAGGGGCTGAPGAGLLVGLLALALGRGTALAQSAAPGQDPAEPLTDEELMKLAEEQAAGEVIVVTGTRSETPRAASPVTTEVIDRKRLQESGVQTVSEALSLRPGIWIDRGISGDPGVSLQGLSPQYTLILVDGARQIGRTDGVLDLDRFSLENIEQIEIVRGPASVLYGSDALGGVINLVTRTPKEGIAADGLVRIDSRLAREARGRVAGGRGALSGSITGSYREGDAIRLGDPAAIGTSIDAYDDARAVANGTYRAVSGLRIDAHADYGQRDLYGIDASATGAVFDRRNLVETASAGTSATYAGERTAWRAELRGSFYRDQFLLNQRLSTAGDQYQVTDENLVEGRVQFAHQRGRHRGLVGVEGLREALKSPRLIDGAYHDRYRAAVFAQDEWKLGADYAVLVVPAARLDIDTQFGTHATPRLAARWQLAEGAALRGSLGMGYRAPNFKELLLRFANPGVGYVVEGSEELQPERSVSFQLGGEYQAAAWLWFGGDLYLNLLNDMITTATAPDDGSGTTRFVYDNIECDDEAMGGSGKFACARTMGGELYAMATRGRAGLELGYALNVTRDLTQDRALEGLPRHRVTVTTRWRDPEDKLDAFVAAVFTGHRPYYLGSDPDDVTLTKRRWEIRARIAKSFPQGFGAFLGVDNLLGAGDADLDKLQPRTLYTGVEFHR